MDSGEIVDYWKKMKEAGRFAELAEETRKRLRCPDLDETLVQLRELARTFGRSFECYVSDETPWTGKEYADRYYASGKIGITEFVRARGIKLGDEDSPAQVALDNEPERVTYGLIHVLHRLAHGEDIIGCEGFWRLP